MVLTMRSRVDDLLAEIKDAVLCLYLSDLYLSGFDCRSKALIQQIPDDRYTLAEWNQALSYIMKSPCDFQTVQEAKLKIGKSQ